MQTTQLRAKIKSANETPESILVKPLSDLQCSANELFDYYENKEEIHYDLDSIYDCYFSHMLGSGLDKDVVYRRQLLFSHLQKYLRSMEGTPLVPFKKDV